MLHAVPVRLPSTSRPGSPPLGFITIPRGQSTDDCPKSAIVISPKTERIICGRDEDYRRWTWAEVKEAVRINRIDLFQRTPSDMKRYMEFVHHLKRTFGSVLHFIQHERLHWSSVQPSGHTGFEDPTDYRVLYNDWPYGIDLDIVHLVVWTKFELEDDPATNDLSLHARDTIEDFVQKTFCGKGGVSRNNLIWFKNGKSLKSVHALEHFHVMLYKPEQEFIRLITRGDRPMAETLRKRKV